MSPGKVTGWWPRVRLWLCAHLPRGLIVDPYGWFLALLCVLSGLPTMLGLNEPSGIDALLPAWLVLGWGACLTIGGLGLLCGLTSIRGSRDGYHVVTRLPCYRLGLRLLAIASVVYAYAVASVAGWGAVTLAAILLAFAGANGVRLLTLGGR